VTVVVGEAEPLVAGAGGLVAVLDLEVQPAGAPSPPGPARPVFLPGNSARAHVFLI
jgi:hypothetical protein